MPEKTEKDTSTDSDSSTDTASPGMLDDRDIPAECEVHQDCRDDDLFTTISCVQGECVYGRKELELEGVSSFVVESACDAALGASEIYVVTGGMNVKIFRFNSDMSVYEFAEAFTSGNAVSVDSVENGFVVAEGEWGLESFVTGSYQGPAAHVEADRNGLDHIKRVSDVEICSSHIAVAGYEKGLALLSPDLSDLSGMAYEDTVGRVVDAASPDGSYVLVADSLGGAATVVFGEESFETAKIVPTTGRVVSVDVWAQTGLMAEYGAGFSMLDLSEPSSPERLFTVKEDYPVMAVHLLGQQTGIVVLENGEVKLYDLIDVENPRVISSLSLGGTVLVNKVDFNGDRALVVFESGMIVLFQITEPDNSTGADSSTDADV